MKKKLFHPKKAPLILCGTLFFLLFFGPILKKWEVIPILLLGVSTKLIANKKIKRYFMIFLGCFLLPLSLIFIAYFLGFLEDSGETALSSIALHAGIVAFLALYAIESIEEMMSSRQTNIEEVVGALNTYMIIALIYGELYAFVAYFQKDAFCIANKIFNAAFHHSSINDSWPYIYFSFITQTSLGYGDVTPVSHLAQVLVISQTIFGQFYIAVVLAYLLHNYITNDVTTNAVQPKNVNIPFSNEF